MHLAPSLHLKYLLQPKHPCRSAGTRRQATVEACHAAVAARGGRYPGNDRGTLAVTSTSATVSRGKLVRWPSR